MEKTLRNVIIVASLTLCTSCGGLNNLVSNGIAIANELLPGNEAAINQLGTIVSTGVAITGGNLSVKEEMPNQNGILMSQANSRATNHDSITWSYNILSRTLTIAGSGNMPNYTYDKQPWKQYNSVVKKS